MIARIAMMGIVLLTALLLATVVVPAVTFGVWRPDLVVLTVIGFAVADGPGTGARYGFAAGLAVDLLSTGTHLVGTGALVLLLVGYLSGTARPYLSATGLVGQIALAGLATTLAILAFGLLGQLLEVTPITLLAALGSALATGIYSALLAPLVLLPVAALSRRLPGAPTVNPRSPIS